MTFTTTEHAFAQKVVQTYTQRLLYLQMDLVGIISYLMFKSIISRIFNIVLDKYEKKIRNEKCLV